MSYEIEPADKNYPYVKAIPAWFDLTKYRDANSLDLEGWIHQLYLRQFVRVYYLGYVCTGICDDFFVPERIHCISPLVDNISIHKSAMLASALKETFKVPAEIWNAANFFGRLMTKASTESLLHWFNVTAPEEGLIKKNARLEDYVPYGFIHSLLEIDLSAPDRILVDSFKNWLQKKRQEFLCRENRKFSKAMLRRWAINQVLPYLDLTYWAQLTQVRISHVLLGEALFPGNYQGDKVERVRKTTEKNAQEVMFSPCLGGMSAQLTYETGKMLDLNAFIDRSVLLNIANKFLVSDEDPFFSDSASF